VFGLQRHEEELQGLTRQFLAFVSNHAGYEHGSANLLSRFLRRKSFDRFGESLIETLDLSGPSRIFAVGDLSLDRITAVDTCLSNGSEDAGDGCDCG